MKLFAFTADNHLQPSAWANRQIIGDAYHSFSQITAYCNHEEIPLFIGGDLFDKKRPDPQSVDYFITECRNLHAGAGNRVYFVQGDHDHHPTQPWAAIGEYATWIHRTSVDVDGYSVSGLDYTPPDELEASLGLLPQADFLITHQSWLQLMSIGNTDGDATMVRNANFLLTGDYHTVREENLDRGEDYPLRIFSPGSTCMQSIDESPHKSFIVVSIENGDLVFQREPLVTRSRIDLVAPSEHELDAVLTQVTMDQIVQSVSHLPEMIRKPLLRFRFHDDVPNAVRRIEEWASDLVHLFLSPVDSSDEIYVEMDDEHGPCGSFETVLSAVRQMSSEDETVYQTAARLLRAETENVNEEIEHVIHDRISAAMARDG